MSVFFVLVVLIVQLGFLVVARTTVAASLEATARRSGVQASDPDAILGRLENEVESIAPGIEALETGLVSDGEIVRVSMTVRWTPPGPILIPVRFTMTREHAAVVPP